MRLWENIISFLFVCLESDQMPAVSRCSYIKNIEDTFYLTMCSPHFENLEQICYKQYGSLNIHHINADYFFVSKGYIQ